MSDQDMTGMMSMMGSVNPAMPNASAMPGGRHEWHHPHTPPEAGE
jgi:hypothetical protein